MIRDKPLQPFVERALAFAHAALDEPSDDRLATARSCAADALERVRMLEFTLGEARQIVLLVTQLRAVLSVAEQRASRLYQRAQLN
ncbi:MAG: hypothetical protein JWN44_4729 [Myxococcales bacterium]|nr:hypothetical protein [Myxococcales bacterium]